MAVTAIGVGAVVAYSVINRMLFTPRSAHPTSEPQTQRPSNPANIPPNSTSSNVPRAPISPSPPSASTFVSKQWRYRLTYPTGWRITDQEESADYGQVSFVSPDYKADDLVGGQIAGLLVTVHSYKNPYHLESPQWACQWASDLYSSTTQVRDIAPGNSIVTSSGDAVFLFAVSPEPLGESSKAVWAAVTHGDLALVFICGYPRAYDSLSKCVDTLAQFVTRTTIASGRE